MKRAYVVAAVAVVVVAIGGGVTYATLGTGEGDSSNSNPLRSALGLGSGAPKCVDAQGPNSTALEISTALLGLKVRQPDGSITTVGESLQSLDKLPMFDSATSTPISPEQFAEDTYDDVPGGGDAKFVSAICGKAAGLDLKYQSTVPIQDLRSTKGILRGLGREYCGAAKSRGAVEKVREDDKKSFDEFLADPKGQIKQQIDMLDAQIANITTTTPQPSATAMKALRDGRAKLQRYYDNPSPFIAASEELISIKEDAYKFECPQLVKTGAGPECGDVQIPNSNVVGTLKLKSEGSTTCDEAKKILAAYFDNVLEGTPVTSSSILSKYACEQVNLHPDLERHEYSITQCVASGMDYDQSKGLILIPKN